jgi:EAL domain-containing protein (putative c-di-GMP-specific phosphodiesterase class I)/GGDEF domain-containing protein
MSLFRQVWFMMICSALLAFIVALLVSTFSARDYLQTQLYTQSSDTASALALSISQQAGDPAMIELMTNALFDSGHFELVRVTDPHGKVMHELRNRDLPSKVPAWFMELFPIQVHSGQALITHGWKQAGKVEISAHSRFAYESLWTNGRKLLFWMLLGGITVGALMHITLKRIRKPIIQIMEQAQAISERRFMQIPQPNYIELRPVAQAMNSMVERVKLMLDEQSEHINRLKRDANRDPVTGLANRNFFIGRLSSILEDQENVGEGMLYMLRIKDLASLNHSLGRDATDKLLTELATRLAHHADNHNDWQAARLNGADFALLATQIEENDDFAEQLLREVGELAPELNNLVHLGYGEYQKGDSVGSLLSRVDAALARAEAHPHNAKCLAPLAQSKNTRPSAYWRELLQHAINQQQFSFVRFSVLDFAGNELHQELMLRLPDPASGEIHSAGVFMPFATRFGLLTELDLATVQLALTQLSHDHTPLAVNLEAASIRDPQFRRGLTKLLDQARHLKLNHLWFEVNEHALIEDIESLATFGTEMHRYGIKVGVEHFGRQIGSMPKLYDLPLDYLKIDSSYIHHIDQHTGNQQLVKAVVSIANNLNMLTIAELVRTEGEWQQLQTLGVSAATGPITLSKKA